MTSATPVSCQEVREQAAVALLTRGEIGASEAEHVARCDACRREIDDLLPLPQLLALAAPVTAAVPDELMLRRVLRAASRERRSRSRRSVLLAGVAVAAAVVVGLFVVQLPSETNSQVVGAVELHATPAGAQITMSVRGVDRGTHCALVVVDRSGVSSTVTTWDADYQGSAQVTGQSSTPIAEIASVELREVGTDQLLWSSPVPT